MFSRGWRWGRGGVRLLLLYSCTDRALIVEETFVDTTTQRYEDENNLTGGSNLVTKLFSTKTSWDELCSTSG